MEFFALSVAKKKDIKRITFTSIIQSIFSRFIDIDKGLLFNIKHLTLYSKNTTLH